MPLSNVGCNPGPPPPARAWTDDDLTDARLMALVRDYGRHDAFAELLPRLDLAIDRPLWRYLPAAEIPDGRAGVHLRIWARRMLYREDRGTVRGWASRIALYYAWDWLRRHSKAGRPLGDLDCLAVADLDPDPAAAAEEADWAAHVRRLCTEVLDGFPPFVRTCFTLRLQGVEYADIAAIVKRPIGTVASAVHRVRKKLEALTDVSSK